MIFMESHGGEEGAGPVCAQNALKKEVTGIRMIKSGGLSTLYGYYIK